jgi:beta-lactamase superfamily II metal-dependent hydrolase
LTGCPDTTIPTLSAQRGDRVCSPSELQAFRDLSTAAEREDLWVAFVDVGQGDATWIRTPGARDLDAKDILVDAGNCLISSGDCGFSSNLNDGYDSNGAEALVAFMRESGWVEGSPIDYLVATHPDKDHYGGSWRVLDEYSVRRFVSSGIANDDKTYQTLLAKVAAEPGVVNMTPALEAGIDPATPGLRQTELWGRNVTARLLSADRYASTDNAASVVLSLEFQGVRLLLTGDAEEALDETLLSADLARGASLLSSTVLKAGHHGGQGTNTQPFLDRVLTQPRKYAVVSAGRRDNLPAADTVARLLGKVGEFGLYRTDRGDDAKDRSQSPGDYHVLMRVTPEGDLTLCYAYPDDVVDAPAPAPLPAAGAPAEP